MNSTPLLLTGIFVLAISVFGLPSFDHDGFDQFSHTIVQAFPTTRGQFPFTVLVLAKEPSSSCGGVLLNNQWVLTAAHCINNATEFELHLGAQILNDTDEVGRIVDVTKTAIVHNQYNPETFQNDLALIKLSKAIKFTDKIQPAMFPNATNGLIESQNVIAIGWGLKHMDESTTSPTLRFAPLTMVRNEKCNNTNCAEAKYIQSVCNGDSGGPLVLESDNRTLVGISGSSNIVGCHFGIPQAYSRIAKYLDWITSIMKKN